MPGTFLRMKCPKCGEEYDYELIDAIYYPGIDEPHQFYGACNKCGEEWEVPYQIEVFAEITLLEPKSKH